VRTSLNKQKKGKERTRYGPYVHMSKKSKGGSPKRRGWEGQQNFADRRGETPANGNMTSTTVIPEWVAPENP